MSTLSTWSGLADIDGAPPPFLWQGKTVVPVAFSRYELSINLDVAQKRAVGLASIHFSVSQRGCPLLDMRPEPMSIEVNGQKIQTSRFPEIEPPDNQASVRVLDVELGAGAHQLIIEYELTGDTVSFRNNSVQLDFFMTDLYERGYLEQHAPANLEFNQFPLTVEIAVSGAGRTPELFTNGIQTISSNKWRVNFPAHFSSSSFFLHLSDRAFDVQNDTFDGQSRSIPLIAYGDNKSDLPGAIATAKTVLAELESTYGGYAHDQLMMYVTSDLGGGGMEYCGAAMTSLDALPHEILHSWFARGVMPANGNAGWIDEAIARWRDHRYPTRLPDSSRKPTQLAGFSPFRRHTPSNAYRDGSMLLSELDHIFGQGGGSGLRPVLSALYQRRRLQQITTDYFKSFLENELGHNLDRVFDQFVYGRAAPEFLTFEHRAERRSRTEVSIQEYEASAPPMPRGFTREELNTLR